MNTEEFNKIEKEFLDYLKKIWEDINDSIKILRKNDKSFVKSEVCLAMICADSLSRFYKILQGSTEDDLDKEIGKRFKKWFNDFVFTDKNDIYKNHKNEIRCDVDSIWKLRNSLLHFYGLPKPQKDGMRINFCSSGNSDECEKLKKFIKERGEKIILIQPYFLIEAILNGLLLQLTKMKNMIENKPQNQNYIQRVLFAHKIAMTEGAVFIGIRKKYGNDK